jgi:hypothetical protein
MVRKVVRAQERKYPAGNYTVEQRWVTEPLSQAEKMGSEWRPINLLQYRAADGSS